MRDFFDAQNMAEIPVVGIANEVLEEEDLHSLSEARRVVFFVR